jgi:hypothetical protein
MYLLIAVCLVGTDVAEGLRRFDAENLGMTKIAKGVMSSREWR